MTRSAWMFAVDARGYPLGSARRREDGTWSVVNSKTHKVVGMARSGATAVRWLRLIPGCADVVHQMPDERVVR